MWMPAFAGMTTGPSPPRTRHSRARGNPDLRHDRRMPAFAGMTDLRVVPDGVSIGPQATSKNALIHVKDPRDDTGRYTVLSQKPAG